MDKENKINFILFREILRKMIRNVLSDISFAN